MYLSETEIKPDTGLFKYGVIYLIFSIFFNINVSLAIPADTVNVIARHPESNASSLYQIDFLVSKPIPSNAIIRVTFPSEFDLSEVLIGGSSTINGGFETKVENQTVVLKRSGLGREIRANEKVDVKFAIVKNPETSADNYKITIEIVDINNRIIVKQEKLHKIISKE